MVVRFYRSHAVANSFDYARGFMTENRWRASRQRSMNAMEITMAHPAGDGSYEHLAGTRFVDLDFFHGERLIWSAKNGSFDSHGFLRYRRLFLYTPLRTLRASSRCIGLNLATDYVITGLNGGNLVEATLRYAVDWTAMTNASKASIFT
jgi:hypothetical protein